MPQNDQLRRYLDAGIAFTQMTRQRAQAIVKDLVNAGEIQRDQTQQFVDELVDRSRKNTEMLLDTVRKEVADQLSSLGIATKSDLAALERRLTGVKSSTGSATKTAATKTAAASKKTPKKATKKAPAAKKAGAAKKR
jgi:polyhydroxyalkanoate synthesis regulator phasin